MRSTAGIRACPPMCTGKPNGIPSTLSGENTYLIHTTSGHSPFSFFFLNFWTLAGLTQQKIPECDRMCIFTGFKRQLHFPHIPGPSYLGPKHLKKEINLKNISKSVFFIPLAFPWYMQHCVVYVWVPSIR